MLKKAHIPWTANQLTKLMKKGTIKFDNAVQRGLVWDQNRKSLLIHSMIEDYPIPPFYAAKSENGYDMLDGKQRSDAISDFINNKYFLTNLPEITVECITENEEGEEIEESEQLDINGSLFENLPKDIQEKIITYSLTVYYFDGITDEEINELFFRLNNGKPLSAIELTRVKAKSLDKIKEIGKHEIFTSTLTEKAINKYTNEDIVIKSWAMLNSETPNLETKNIRPLIENAEITEQEAQNLKTIYDKILEVYTTLTTANNKQDTKIAKRIITRTHLISLIPIISKQISNNTYNTEQFTAWAKHFFAGTKSATISAIYNESATSGSGKPDSIKKRLDVITEDFKTYILSGQDIKDSQAA